MHEISKYQFMLGQKAKGNSLKFIECPNFSKNVSNKNADLFIIKSDDFKKEVADSHSELKCTPASLRGHIVKAHFNPAIIADLGVARYDIDLAAYRGFKLDWVVKQAYKRLEESPEMTERRFVASSLLWGVRLRPGKDRYFEYGDMEGYKKMLVKTLRHIDEQGLASVDWNRVALSVANLEEITLDIDRDSIERPFRESARFPVFK